jgi:hypothetical protein
VVGELQKPIIINLYSDRKGNREIQFEMALPKEVRIESGQHPFFNNMFFRKKN